MLRALILTYCFCITLLFAANMYASYVVYTNSPAGTTTTIGSMPIAGPGSFSYSDGFGNSFSSTNTQYVPFIINTAYPQIWVWPMGGYIPPNAIVYQYVNGYPVFYCRVFNRNQAIIGVLVPNEGCYLQGNSRPINSYQVLVR